MDCIWLLNVIVWIDGVGSGGSSVNAEQSRPSWALVSKVARLVAVGAVVLG